MAIFTPLRIAVLVAITLSACVPIQPDSPSLPQRIIPVPDGLKIANSGGREISFGRMQLGVEVAINRLVGAMPNDGGVAAPGCEFRSWKNGLILVFDKRKFVGWVAGPPVWQNLPASAGNACGWTP